MQLLPRFALTAAFATTLTLALPVASAIAAPEDVPTEAVAKARKPAIFESLVPATVELRADAAATATRGRMFTAVSTQIEHAFAVLQKQKSKSKGQVRAYANLLALRLELIVWAGAKRTDAIGAARSLATDIVKLYGKKASPLSLMVQNAITGDTAPFTQLIQKNPEAGVAGEAHAVLGDRLYFAKNFTEARAHYLAALGYKELTRRDWIAMRLAWCNYLIGQKPEAIAGLKSVAKPEVAKSKGKGKSKNKDKDKAEPRGESLRLLAHIYSEQGDLAAGIAALKSNGGDEFIPSLEYQTASILAIDPKRSKYALPIYADFLRLAPDASEAANAKMAMTALDLGANAFDKVNADLTQLHQNFGPASTWQKNQRKDGKSAAAATSGIRDLTEVAADSLFVSAMTGKDKKALKAAKTAFTLHMKNGQPDAADVVRGNWALAVLAERLGDLKDAGANFDAIVIKGNKAAALTDQRTGKPLNVHEIAARRAIAAYSTTPQIAYVTACQRFADAYPTQKELIKVCDLKIPDVHLALKDPTKAKAALTVVAKRYADAPEGPAAVKRLFTMVGKDSPEQLTRANELLTVKTYQAGEFGGWLRNLAFTADLAGVKATTDAKARLDGYERLARDNPAQPIASTLWMTAASEALALGRPLQASEDYRKVLEKYDGSKNGEQANLSLAELSEQMFDLEGAERYYTRFIDRYPASGGRRIAAEERRCMLRVALESPTALEACESYGQRDPKVAKLYVERLISKAARDGRVDYLKNLVDAHYLNKYAVTPNEKIIAQYRVFTGYHQSGDAARAAEASILQTFGAAPAQVSGEAKHIVAELKYRGVLVTRTLYDQQNLEGGKASVDDLIKAIGVKQKALDNLLYNFTKVIDLADPAWSAACNYELGRAYESFADMLSNPPAIAGIAAEHVKVRLIDQAAVIRGEAKRYYKVSLDLMHKNDVVNEFGVKSVDGLARLDGQRFRYDDWLETPAYFGSEASAEVVRSMGGELR